METTFKYHIYNGFKPKIKKIKGQLEGENLDESLKLILKTTEYLSNTIDTFNNFFKQNKEKSLFNLKENIENNILLVIFIFQRV